MKTTWPLIVTAVVLFIIVNTTLFVVPQAGQALILQFGEIVRVIDKPGLNAKLPFVQSVMRFDKRILEFEAQPAEFITRNREMDVDERVVIDAFVRYRITDPVQFYKSVKTESNLNSRLNSIVLSSMRRVLAGYSLNDLLSKKRGQIMQEIKANVNAQAKGVAIVPGQRTTQGFGVEVVDLRIVRADLPSDISQATYERMRKNFTKEAQRFRAEGDQQATETKASADRERTEILAGARKQAETIRGEGDAEAAKIYANAFGRDPDFFKFYRSMQAYRAALSSDDTTVVLTPDSGFLDEMKP